MILDDDVVDPGVARAQSRIGMGRCQGRNCAHFVAATIARRKGMKIEDVPPLSVRPPVRPIPLAAIAEDTPQPAVEIAVS